MASKKITETKSDEKFSGIPMNEESYKEWCKAFTDIVKAIYNLYKGDDKNERSNKSKVQSEKKTKKVNKSDERTSRNRKRKQD